MIIVLTLSGKGNDSRADTVQANVFTSNEGNYIAREKAEEFINATQNTSTKYWVQCEIVDNGEAIETMLSV